MFNGQKLLFTIVVWSEQCVENENRVKGVKRLKLDLVRIIEYFMWYNNFISMTNSYRYC